MPARKEKSPDARPDAAGNGSPRTRRKRIGIFVIAYNAVNKLSWTIDRIPRDVLDRVDEVFLFDDCSTDNTYYAAVGYKHVKDFAKLTVHRNARNLRYGGNQKAGYEYAISRGHDIVVMLHADGQYAPEVLNELLAPLENDEADMVFGSRMAAGGQPLQGGMPLYKFIGNKILTWLENRIIGMQLSEFHSGYRLYSTAALEKIPFRLNSNEWHFDTEILIQYKEAGLRIAERPIPTYYGDEICYVNGLGYAFNCIKTALKYRLHKSRLIYERKFDVGSEKYVHKKNDPYSSHSHIVRWVSQHRPRRVLEVGCAGGFLSAEMKRLGCEVTGLELDERLAEQASAHCDRVLRGNVETMDLSDLGTYDAIICGDILEHLQQPAPVLQRLVEHLAPGATMLISLPNVANIYVRLNLLLGRFEYTSVGILDDTHLRFYTLASATRMIKECGLDILSMTPTPIPLPAAWPATGEGGSLHMLHKLNAAVTGAWPTLFGYQFIFVCKARV
jgi:glycosyltransferase involved in cell wall biosynthesis/precorrin-6B methylase 2